MAAAEVPVVRPGTVRYETAEGIATAVICRPERP